MAPYNRVEIVWKRTGSPSSAGAAKLLTPSAKASSVADTTAGITTGSAIARATFARVAPVISPASSRSPLTDASAAATSRKASE